MRFTRIAACSLLFATLTIASPAFAWWQFVSLGPNGLRQIHSPFKDEASCQAALKKVAERMKIRNIGSLPVCRDGKLVGMITDRDVTVRVTAEGLDGKFRARVGYGTDQRV